MATGRRALEPGRRALDSSEVFGAAAEAHFRGGAGPVTLVFEGDGPGGLLAAEPMARYFPGGEAQEPEYGLLLDHLGAATPPRRVLDVGCGPGRFLARFAALGDTAVGVDRSPQAVAVARQVTPAAVHCRDAWHLSPRSLGRFDLVVLFGHNLGIAGTPDRARRLLGRLRRLARPGGRLAVNSLHKERLDVPAARAQVAHARAAGRYPGQIRCRLHYSQLRSRWFSWIHAAPADLDAWAGAAGWDPLARFERPGAPAFWSGLYQARRSAPRGDLP